MAVLDSLGLLTPTTDTTSNILISDVLGSKLDTMAGTSLVSINRRVGGYYATATKNLAGSGATENINLFQITGSVRVLALYGQVTAKTTLTNMTDCHWNLYDSTAAVAITKATTLTMSTAIVGSIVSKSSVATDVARFVSGSVGAVTESATLPETDYQCILTQKTAANTYIRWSYTTTDAPIAATMKFYVIYLPINSGTLVAV